METETHTKQLRVREHTSTPDAFVINGLARQGYREGYQPVTRAELEAIVQQAYDQHGILATPSYDTEAVQG